MTTTPRPSASAARPKPDELAEESTPGRALADAPGTGPAGGAPHPRIVQIAGAAMVLVALALPVYLVIENEVVRGAAFGGFVGIFLGVLSVMVGLVRVALRRKSPQALGLATLAALLGAAGPLLAALGAEMARGAADGMVFGDVALEPGMREFLTGQAQGNGRTAGLLGLLGLPGFALGMFLLFEVLRARRSAAAAAKIPGAGVAPVGNVTRAWAGVISSIAAVLTGLGADVYMIAQPVAEAPNPRESRLVTIVDARTRGDMKSVCTGLEMVLGQDFVSQKLLEKHLPDRLELAHRCVTLQIDELPRGEGCRDAAKALLVTPTVKLAKAEERIGLVCKGR